MVIGTCIKYPGGRARIKGADVVSKKYLVLVKATVHTYIPYDLGLWVLYRQLEELQVQATAVRVHLCL
jgi:hypothetical protein